MNTIPVLTSCNLAHHGPQVEFEHAILNALAKSGIDLSFQVPKFIPSKKDGKTHITLSSGASVALWCDAHMINAKLAPCSPAVRIAPPPLRSHTKHLSAPPPFSTCRLIAFPPPSFSPCPLGLDLLPIVVVPSA